MAEKQGCTTICRHETIEKSFPQHRDSILLTKFIAYEKEVLPYVRWHHSLFAMLVIRHDGTEQQPA